MPNIPTYRTQRLPSTNVGSAPISPQAADTNAGAIGAGLANIGQDIFSLGEKVKVAQDTMTLSVLDRDYTDLTNQYEKELSTITDPDLAQKKIAEYETKASQLYTGKSNAVRNAFTVNVNRTIGDKKRYLGKVSEHAIAKDAADMYDNSLQRAIDANDEKTATSIIKMAKDAQVIGPAKAEADTVSLPTRIIWSQARQEMVTNPEGVISTLNELKTNAKSILGRDLTPEELDVTDQLISKANKQSEVSSSEANKQLTDLMASQRLSISEIQARRDVLSDSDYEAWTKIAMNPADKKGNLIKTTELKSMTMDVWRGTLSRKDAEEKIRQSLADPNGINDEQYAAIYADLDREVKSFQAQDTKTYSIEATRLILGKDAGAMSFDALGNMTIDVNKLLSPEADFEKKMHFIGLYNKSMSDFLAANPDVSKKDLYTKSQELKATYMRAAKGIKTETWQLPDNEYTRSEGKILPEWYKEQEQRDESDIKSNEPHRRPNGTITGPGYLGTLVGKTGMGNTEISIGIKIDGKYMDVPTLVPTLTDKEKKYLIDTPENKIFTENPELFKSIKQKAIDHAKQRIKNGESPFKENNVDDNNPTPDELRRQGTEEAYNIGVQLGYWE